MSYSEICKPVHWIMSFYSEFRKDVRQLLHCHAICTIYIHVDSSTHSFHQSIYLFLCRVRIVDFVKRKHFLLLVVVDGNNVAVGGEL